MSQSIGWQPIVVRQQAIHRPFAVFNQSPDRFIEKPTIVGQQAIKFTMRDRQSTETPANHCWDGVNQSINHVASNHRWDANNPSLTIPTNRSPANRCWDAITQPFVTSNQFIVSHPLLGPNQYMKQPSVFFSFVSEDGPAPNRNFVVSLCAHDMVQEKGRRVGWQKKHWQSNNMTSV